MKKYVIKGGIPLEGEVVISGSKNSSLPIMAATLLCDEPVILHNIPILRDIFTMKCLLEKLGKKVESLGQNSLRILPDRDNCYQADYEIVKQMRASITVLGPLLAKHQRAEVSFPGGCVFGPRPIDLHIKGLKKLGAQIDINHGIIKARAPELIGTTINLMGEFGTSVLATDNVLMGSIFAQGTTIIENAAQEPETIDLVNFLNKMGAKIKQNTHSSLEIEGVKKLGGGEYTVISDRVEAGSFLVFSTITGGEVKIIYPHLEHISSVFNLAEEIGIPIRKHVENNDGFTVKSVKMKDLKDFTVTTLPYPLFPTDLQPVFGTLATMIPGHSTIIEKVFQNRFSYAAELSRMGAEIQISNGFIIIKGVEKLQGAVVQASDLRASAALVAAGLVASNTTEVRRVYHGERGYENLPDKLQKLGGKIEVETDDIV